MKLFESREIFEAYKYVLGGGQALHVYKVMSGGFPNAPACFKKTKRWGHLLDQDEKRLMATARRLGVKRVVVGRRGTMRQHVDLCGAPLARAKAQCEERMKGEG